MEFDPNEIRVEAARLVDENKSLDALKTLAEINKILSEKQKTDVEIDNQQWEWLKTGATAIVPLLTLITLAVTVYFQWAQANITKKSNEDVQWKTLTETMGRPPSPTVDASVIASLIPFYHSDVYQVAAYDTVLLLARRLVDANNFGVLYKSAFGRPSWDNVDNTLNLIRSVKVGFDELQESFDLNKKYTTPPPMFGMPTSSVSPPQLLPAPMPNQQPSIRNIYASQDAEYVHWRREQLKEEIFLCDRIGEVLRTSRPWFHDVQTDFSNIFLYGGNLDHANIDGISLDGSRIEYVTLRDAILNPKDFANSVWSGTTWWDAARISPELLDYLVENFPPNTKSDITESVVERKEPISRDEYLRKVDNLCAKVGKDCKDAKIKFNTPE